MQNSTVETLNGFLRGEISAVETYRQAIEKLNGSSWRPELQICHRSHEWRVQQLREQIQRFGGHPVRDSGAWGTFARLVEGGAKAFGEKAAISALEEGEDHGLKIYRNDLDKLDPVARAFVERDVIPAQERTHLAVSVLKHELH